jgi:charged multivesicular body protein 4
MEKAREFTRQKKKSQALMCLKKKKMYEQQLERLDALVSRVMEQKNMLEEQQTTLGVLSDMAQAAKAQKKTMAVGGPCFEGEGGLRAGLGALNLQQ